MTIANCQTHVNHSRIKLEENRSKATFINEQRATYIKTKVDGCVVKGATAADWVLSRPQIGDVIVELKGSDFPHAVDQVRATAELWRTQAYVSGKMGALIVCAQYPKISTQVQKAMSRFAKEFRAPLKTVSRPLEYKFEDLLSFG